MDKNTFGAIVAANLLTENKTLDKVAGWVGTKLGEGYKVARKASAPYVGAGLEGAGKGIVVGGRNLATGIVKIGGKVGKAIDDRTLKFGRNIYNTGRNLKDKYKKV